MGKGAFRSRGGDKESFIYKLSRKLGDKPFGYIMMDNTQIFPDKPNIFYVRQGTYLERDLNPRENTECQVEQV